MKSLQNISPVDGRYKKYTEALAPYFSEYALSKYKVLMECEYLIALSETPGIKMRAFSGSEKALIRKLYNDFSLEDAQIINDIELKGYKNIKATNHDFKAIEYFLKEKLGKTSLKDSLEWIHFGLTSEDANNIAYGLMISESLKEVMIPALEKVIIEIKGLVRAGKDAPILARTHGQPASPTTFGKEFKVFEARLKSVFDKIKSQRVMSKLNGATGNYNALVAAFPKIDWIKFSRNFIGKLNKQRKTNLVVNLFTTQIESHDSYAELFNMVRRVNTILIDLDQDIWRYISDGWLGQKQVAGEIGSSTMPHKINPIFVENSEGNLGMANAMLDFFSMKLPISRLQRDLSDSTVLRNIGAAFGHCLIGYKYLGRQLERIVINKDKALADLDSHPEVIAEAIQTILRREGASMPYEKLKALTRGKEVALKDFQEFIDGLEISGEVKIELKKIRPENYLGLAKKLSKI
ncbi:MAG: adenylosuccinate lyase [Patescibacteria group bacterium]|jgi:adenylosuccinate lyase